MLLSLSLSIAVALAAPTPPAASAAVDDAAFTAGLVAELRGIDPAAAALFEQADAARTLGELSRAGELYGQVTGLVPGFDHAWRRHCTVLQEAGLRSEALPRCRRALDLDPRAENRVALATVLLDLPSGKLATAADRQQARAQLDAAWLESPDDPMNARLRCHLAMEDDDLDLLRACTADLERLAPDHVMTGFHAWALAFREERWGDALSALDRAQAAGMPAADAEGFRRLTREARPWWWTWGPALAMGAALGGATWVLGGAIRRRRPGGGAG